MPCMGRAAKKSHMNADEFRKLRKALGLTQGQLGKWLDFSINAISEMERGNQPISKPLAMLIASAANNQPVKAPKK